MLAKIRTSRDDAPPFGTLIPCDMRTLIAPLSLLSTLIYAQAPVNGPMPGVAGMMEEKIWLQCHAPCRAAIAYWDVLRPDSLLRTDERSSSPDQGHALIFTLRELKPGTRYGYRVELDGHPVDVGESLYFSTQALWQHRTDPPEFSIAMGSCAYVNEAAYDRPGKPYGGGYGIFNSIADQKPDLMLWLGDNIYLREPDWGSWSGILHRYTHSRSLPELQHLLRSTQHVALWDDHDFGPNDADGSFVNAGLTERAFDLFWPNPASDIEGVGGITTMLEFNDVDLFVLDDRTHRVPADMKTARPTLLGDAQIGWLIQALKYSKAPFKLVAMGGQFLSTAAEYENYATVPYERQAIIDRIDREGITGVIFLTGDRHFTELSELVLPDSTVIRDLTVSPLTSSTYAPSGKNTLSVHGTVVTDRNFAVLRFSGPKGGRVMRIEVRDGTGALRWERAFAQPGPSGK